VTRANFTTPVTVLPRTAGVDYTITATGKPTIGGTPQVGVPLTAHEPVYHYPDGVTPFGEPTTVKYQWYRGTTAIPNAVASTYTPVAADDGKLLSVKIAPTAPGHLFKLAFATSDPTAAVAKGVIDDTGTGPTFTITSAGVATAKWAGVPAVPGGPYTSTYKWYREGVTAPISSTSTYKLATADTNKRVTVVVTIGKAGYTTLVSVPLDVNGITAQDGIGLNSAAVPAAGTGLSLALPTFLHAGSATETVTYQWMRGDDPIPGATGDTYTLADEDVDEQVWANVTVASPKYLTTTFESPKSDTVVAAP
jgi:hypothetical protein